jgi:urease accessory protein
MKSMPFLISGLLLPSVLLAHPGHSTGFGAGLAHPPAGLDHICAMLAVGLWAAQLGGRALWILPLAFMLSMAGGGLLANAGFQLPLVESGIAASLCILGLLVAFAARLPVALGALVAAVFAVFHGFAHGAEMPAEASSVLYALGFTLSTALLHAAGIGTGKLLNRAAASGLVRAGGAAIALAGLSALAG